MIYRICSLRYIYCVLFGSGTGSHHHRDEPAFPASGHNSARRPGGIPEDRTVREHIDPAFCSAVRYCEDHWTAFFRSVDEIW